MPSRRTIIELRKTILTCLSDNEFSIHEISKKTNIDWFTVERQLTYLKGLELVTETFRHRLLRLFRITEFGNEVIKELLGSNELMKIIMSDNAREGIDLLREFGLLKHIIPELEAGYGVGQNKHHIYEIYEHNLRCLAYAAKKGYNKYVRIAALLHDVAKPQAKRGEGKDSTFYGHEIGGAKMAQAILERLKFSKKDILKVIAGNLGPTK